MDRKWLLITILIISMFIAGCNRIDTDSQTTTVGKLILDQDRLMTIKVIRGSSEQKSIEISDSDYIRKLLDEVKAIPVKRLSKDEDVDFMQLRIQDEAMISIFFYEYDSLKGGLVIWPDGYVYAVDSGSMVGNQRTVSYLSESKYPEVYELVGGEEE